MAMYLTEPESCDPGRLRRPQPTKWRCLECDWRGEGYVDRALHAGNTGHQVIWAGDPRPSGTGSAMRASA